MWRLLGVWAVLKVLISIALRHDASTFFAWSIVQDSDLEYVTHVCGIKRGDAIPSSSTANGTNKDQQLACEYIHKTFCTEFMSNDSTKSGGSLYVWEDMYVSSLDRSVDSWN